MIEFGEKVKKLREEKGMTQQTMAEKLYVTRQAVSRWECGARYPDLLMAKKIGQILDVSIDELVSGEELKKDVEKEPILAKPVENILQTILYTVAMISYLLMSIFGVYSFFPNEGLKGTPAGEISIQGVIMVIGHLVNLLFLVLGLIMSVRNKLTAKITGFIMAIPYFISVVTLAVAYIDMRIKKNGNQTFGNFLLELFIPLLCVVCIMLYFCLKEKRMSQYVIYAICVFSFLWIAYGLKNSLLRITDLGFVIRTVHSLGKIGWIILLGYQAHMWNKKRKLALK